MLLEVDVGRLKTGITRGLTRRQRFSEVLSCQSPLQKTKNKKNSDKIGNCTVSSQNACVSPGQGTAKGPLA